MTEWENRLETLERAGLTAISFPQSQDDSTIDPNERLCCIAETPQLKMMLRQEEEGFLRATTLDRLEDASKILPNGFALAVFDAWRSLARQRAVFQAVRSRLADVKSNAHRFAFSPDDPARDVDYPSDDPPHCTGGAVDVGLVGPCGELWPMGTGFDETVDDSATDAYENRPLVGRHEKAVLLGRRLLFRVMTSVGFSNYPQEWWHYDFGNAFWRYFGNTGVGPVYRTTTPHDGR